MDICEKIAYIKGLAEGLSLDETTKEGKILAAIIDLLGDITEEICDIEDGCDELLEQIDAVDEDLASLEDIIYEDDEDDCECDCDCDCEDDEVYEIECPACNDVIYLDADMLAEEGMVCPNCGTDLEFDFDGCDCDCDCDCGCEETEE
ncbi:MAG: hypothetical protein UHM16_04040 [Acutalibacteraceae bacterium]|nr:hypothetical protein [Acutalibacteraceae bacterium]